MFDLIIKNGKIIDGISENEYVADIGIIHDKIEKIGNLNNMSSKKEIDANGYYVTPGFIDIHRHADFAVFRGNFGEAEIFQGITTIVNGNCGISVAPIKNNKEEIKAYIEPITGINEFEDTFYDMKTYLDSLKTLPVNVGILCGAGTVRASVASYNKEKLNEYEYDEITKEINSSIENGALGVSLGLGYAPECFYTTDELSMLLSKIKDKNVTVTIHMRNEGDKLLESIREVIKIAKDTSLHIHISHLKAMGKEHFNVYIKKALELIMEARNDKIKIDCDFYPYTAGSTMFMHILPPEFLLGGVEKIVERLIDKNERIKIKERIQRDTDFENIVRLASFDGIYITSVKTQKNKKYIGKNLIQIAQSQNKDPFDAAFDLLIEEDCEVTMIDFMACDEDIVRILKSDFSNVISDSTYPLRGKVHPRVYGTFTRVLSEFVKKRQEISLVQAINKMSSFPANVLGINNKGILKENYDADINIFKLEDIKENATYENPDVLSSGLRYVIVNGKIVKDQNGFILRNAGKVIRR